jgi:hypothetical protein
MLALQVETLVSDETAQWAAAQQEFARARDHGHSGHGHSGVPQERGPDGDTV